MDNANKEIMDLKAKKAAKKLATMDVELHPVKEVIEKKTKEKKIRVKKGKK